MHPPTAGERLARVAPLAGALVMSGVLGAALTGCGASPRAARPEADLLRERDAYGERLAGEGRRTQAALVARLVREREAHARGASATPATLDVLILSGGGDYGAFGAGFLRAWGSVPPGEDARPEFDAVTGVSTGALIAPFAFAGDEGSYARIDMLYRSPRPDWVRERWLLTFLLREAAYFDVDGLEAELARAVDDAMVRRIAQGARDGRALAVGATNIDLGRQRAFVLSDMALAGGDDPDPSPIRDALLASSAIPIAFPPRQIGGHLYVDGGLTSNILFSGDPESPRGFSAAWRAANPGAPLPRVRYWVIVNNQMTAPPRVVQPRWSSLGGPTVETAIRASTAGSLRELSLLVRLQRAAGIDSRLRWVSIPDDWRPPAPGMFEPETMRDLADLGARLGADPRSWREDAPE